MSQALSLLGLGIALSCREDAEAENQFSGMTVRFGASINTVLANFVSLRDCRRLTQQMRLALSASCDALHTAGWDPSEDMAVVIGTQYGNTAASMDMLDSLCPGDPTLASPTAFACSVTNSCASTISIHLGIRGPLMTVSQGMLSFAEAARTAFFLLESGRATKVLLGASEDYDPRLRLCAQRVGQSFPKTGGAVFFSVSKASEQYPLLSFTQKSAGTPSFGQSTYGPLAQAIALAKAFARRENGVFSAQDYGWTVHLRLAHCRFSAGIGR
ncbi:MAG: beta-ketoacyl synthase chain length factor [Desulfovibrionaceae bacterium]|nr:beta-ketoacyl synthase chain length factor [Desulfovibrionaceae bacterium]